MSLQHDNTVPFQTADNGLGFLYSKEYPSPNVADTVHLQPSLNVYVSFFKPEINNFTEPVIIYQTSISNLTMKDAYCSIDTFTLKFKCIVRLRKTSLTDQLNVTSYNLVLLISFHSSGSVTNVEEILDRDFIDADLFFYQTLLYGGYFLGYMKFLKKGCLGGGNYYDNNNEFYSYFFGLKKHVLLPFPCVIIPNNYVEKIVEMVSEITSTNFTIIAVDPPRFINDGKFIYL